MTTSLTLCIPFLRYAEICIFDGMPAPHRLNGLCGPRCTNPQGYRKDHSGFEASNTLLFHHRSCVELCLWRVQFLSQTRWVLCVSFVEPLAGCPKATTRARERVVNLSLTAATTLLGFAHDIPICNHILTSSYTHLDKLSMLRSTSFQRSPRGRCGNKNF